MNDDYGDAGFFGPHDTYEACLRSAPGGCFRPPMDPLLASVRRVEAGEGRFERDGVVFDHEEYNWPVLACVLHALAAAEGEEKVVVDFGGGLGSFWRQHRGLLPWKKLKWCVVELPALVAAGREFEGDVLRFHESIGEVARQHGAIHCVLMSGVICYLERLEPLIGELRRHARAFVVSRIWFSDSPADEYWLQRTPPEIYKACSVFRLFGKAALEGAFEEAGFVRKAAAGEEEKILIGGRIKGSSLQYWNRSPVAPEDFRGGAGRTAGN